MGLDPGSWALIASVLGGSALGGIMAPDGQELQSFAGTGGTDPRVMLGEGKDLVVDALNALLEDAGQPVTMQTTVNPLPSFVGGGLPMAISAPGMDANRLNPQLRTQPGINIPRRRLRPGQPGGSGGTGGGSNSGNDNPGGGI